MENCEWVQGGNNLSTEKEIHVEAISEKDLWHLNQVKKREVGEKSRCRISAPI